MIYKNLYDLAGLSLIDSDTDSVIFTDAETVESVFSTQNSKKEFAEIFRANLNKKFKTGDIIVVSNEDMTVKAYCLITIICGEIVPYVLYYIDMNRGEESIRNFSIADIEMLSAYPILTEPEELIFFLTKLSIVFAENAPADYRKYIQVIKSYLDKGLWAANITWPADDLAIKHTKSIMDNMGYRLINEGKENTFVNRLSDISYEKNGQILSFMGNGIYGPYEEVRKAYCEMSSMDGYESMIYNDFFGLLFTDEVLNGQIVKGLIEYEEILKKALTPKPIERSEEVVVDKIVNAENKIEAQEENFLSKMDSMLEGSIVEDNAKSKTKRKDKAIESFNIDAEISPEEMALAVNETITKIPIKIKVPALTKGSKLNQVSKEKDSILNSPQNSYPVDWNHIYSVGETSKSYNLTYGQTYDDSTDMFYENSQQQDGMSIEDWNAYFIAHPELSHLIDETIGHLGGVFKTQQDLMETGHLLYDVKNVRLVYRHEYIKGNVYKLIDELESVKDVVIKLYKQPFYDTQMDILLSSRPEMKKITSADPKKIPFIHPLDETIIDYKINSAAGITYQNNQNKPLMIAEKIRLEEGIKNGSVQAQQVPAMLDEFSARLQSLPITVFFMEWLSGQYGKIAEYGLPDIELVINLYFDGMAYSKYADALVDRGIIRVPTDKKSTDVVSTSDYFEAKDSAKRFVNDLFQEFLINEVSESDRDAIEYQWNKRYNGYASPDVWKLPIFIRHSKYFKNRKNKRKLKLTEVQIKGIKFATIENSSIMAHEVGYGKTLVAIGYMSHCFETRQASNFLISVPKTLYVNKKWREEVYGLYDEAKDNFIIGATPNYNLIELGNFSTTEIYGGGKKSKYKNYSDDDLDKINYLGRIFTEIGGKESGVNKSSSVGTATVPNNPYNYKQAISVSNFAWSKLINTIFPGIDPVLFNRCKGKNAEEYNVILETLANYNLGTTAKDKATNIVMLVSKIIDLKWYYQKHLTLFDSSVKFSGRVAYDDNTQKLYDSFAISTLPSQFKKDKDGKVLLDKNGAKILRPVSAVAQEYILIVLSELHKWIQSICQRMKDFAIYEYGSWTFGTSDRNIILATKECFNYLGFSSKYLEGIKSVIEEITTYKSEENFDSQKGSSVTILDDLTGEKKSYKRNPQKVLQKQLQELLNKINDSMTEEGKRGKFFLDNLKIDGFILDEAHIAKKLFTNVKTDANVKIDLADGKSILIKTSSHDIKGGSAPDVSLAVFSVCQYIRALGNRKPLMLLTATPFSNQPTEIFSMLSLVGINQLRDYGISNIKNFFDLFLKETLKYDFNQNGEFIKRVTIEDFRNKEMLINLIWSVMDIRREATLDKGQKMDKKFGDKPYKMVFPKLSSDSSMQKANVSSDDDANTENDSESLGNINTIALLNRMSTNTCSIVDQNDIQRKTMADIEKVVTKQVNPKTQLEYTFDDFCPNAAVFQELESKEKSEGGTKKKGGKTDEEEERDSVVVTLRTLLNSNVTSISGGVNLKDYQDVQNYYASVDFKNAKIGTLIFVKEGFNTGGFGGGAGASNYSSSNSSWQLYKKALKQIKGSPSVEYMQLVTDESTASDTIKTLTKNIDYGTTFKALGISKSIALSPYLYRCDDLPEPTPENIIKYSPKIEYLVKALKMIKDYHINEIPKKIDYFKADLKKLQGLSNPTQADLDQIDTIRKELPQLENAKEVSGQVVYMNIMRFNHYYIDSNGNPKVEKKNIAELIIQYLIDKGWFTADEVKLFTSETGDKDKEAYIKGFQDGTIKVLFGSPAIKEGIDLQNKASTMYIMTPDWNPTDMRQVEGRIWRRDNENKYIRIVYVLLDQSIEVFIYSKLEEKAARLQQVMQERREKRKDNDKEELDVLEEMSLNPNETKVALASNPVKRADIITKLSAAVLEDQKNKINKDRVLYNKITNSIEKVYENIEIIKSNYLIPYLQEVSAVNIRYYDFQLKIIIDEYINSKRSFLNNFANNFEHPELTVMPPDPVFKVAISHLQFRPSMETLIYCIWNTEANEMYDLLNGLEVCIDNKDEFVQAIKNGSNSLALITQKSPLRFAPNSQRIDGYLFCDKPGGNDELYRLFTAGAVLYRMTDEQLAELKAILNSINSKRGVSMVSRQEIRNMMEGFVVFAVEKYNEYAMNHPSLRPENFGKYIYYKNLRDRQKVSIVVDTFDSLDLNDKLKEIIEVYTKITQQFVSWESLGVPTQRDIMSGKNKIPYQSEILVKLGLAVESRQGGSQINQIRLTLDEIFNPIIALQRHLKEIQRNVLSKRGLTINDIPMLQENSQAEYDNINKKLEALELSRIKLVERFEKMDAERKNIGIDQLIAKFALTNNYLNYKLQD